ncbi:MAG TPA: pilus assembly protein TadG-related protein, partial [Solirubrobacteraceae bacterium]
MHARLQQRVGDERGQVIPLVPVVFLAILAVTLVLVYVGRSTSLSAQAQTGADAAALAAENDVKAQLGELDGGSDPTDIDMGRVRAAAEDYAHRNGAHVLSVTMSGFDVLVTVETDQVASRPDDSKPTGAFAKARATLGETFASPGTGSVQAIQPAPGEQGTVFDAMIREADRIDALHLNYDYGGSHGLALAPTDGPFDCSSAVSRILQSTGVMGPPVRVSGDFASYGDPGIGVVTLVIIPGTGGAGHVYLVFHDPKTGHTRAWGTSSSNPGGGPGWIDGYTYDYPGRSVIYRHVPLPALDKKFDPSSLNLGSQFVPGAVPVSFDVHLVAYDGSGSTSGGGLVDLNASQIEIVKQIVKVGHQLGATHKQIVAAIEAGIVESSLRNLPPGAASDGS